jgi:hypothetical protein
MPLDTEDIGDLTSLMRSTCLIVTAAQCGEIQRLRTAAAGTADNIPPCAPGHRHLDYPRLAALTASPPSPAIRPAAPCLLSLPRGISLV